MQDTMNIVGLSGNIADVDSNNKLIVAASILPAIAASAHEDREAYAWTSVTANIDATDTAILLCNNSTSKHLHVTKAYIYSDVPSQLQFHFPAYPTLAGTAITGMALNRTSGIVADATCIGDETGNTQANIFLTISSNELTTDQHGIWVNLEGAVILGYHDCIAIDVVAEAAAYNAGFIGYFHSHD